ncbi:MAG: YigZ family protein [Bacilli bacterium]
MEYVVEKSKRSEIEVEKSIFISYIFEMTSVEDFKNKLSEIKKDNIKARHFCYAYVFEDTKKYSDDGEPQGSAGKPILSVLDANSLSNTALIVVRYFGGTLLGSGRLLRTYSKSAANVVSESKLIPIVEEAEFSLDVDYDYYDIVKNYINRNHFCIINTNFNDRIRIVFYTPKDFDVDFNSMFYSHVSLVGKVIKKHKKEEIKNG